ncbi:DeoR family transcriptional regulator [Paenibacillus taihuensis]|uniref:DeoR family transcriptional regulator n=1 Tax=Paenibacillus taihuensis TaxID=1156355 RepID=A0A3D9RHA2_9BACL|nr:DeoR/GlpR family DNA-binding transcription regulator [Paenibacillus taihuensis]REE77711.1 DeoR family transcriptional regulator [Paenibacillus taihuensis]
MSSASTKRQRQIIRLLQRDGEVKITEMKDLFSVTDMTLRRDLEKLEQSGVLIRTYGGAVLNNKDTALAERSRLRMAEKELIGQTAAKLILPGESIFIDSGSTTLQIARSLPEEASITVVTNAIHVAAALGEKKIPTVVIGGVLLGKTNAMAGTSAIESISKLAFDKVFLGTTGVSFQHGFSNSNMLEADIKRIAIQKAKDAFIVMDHTKFGENALFSFSTLNEVSAIITDLRPSEDWESALHAAATDILIV